MDTITPVLANLAQTLLALALPILAAYLASTLKKFLVAKIADLKAGASLETVYLIDAAVEAGVHAAEQFVKGSDAKLTYAIKLATNYLSARGIALDLDLLRGLIEAEVQREFGKDAPSN